MKQLIPLTLLLYTLLSASLNAQEIPLLEQAKQIDSLMRCSDFATAEQQVTQLHATLMQQYPTAPYIDLTLQVTLFKAGVYVRREQRSTATELALWVADQAQIHRLPEKEFRACLIAAELYEQANYWDLCKTYLNKAYALHQQHQLDPFFSLYCIRAASYYRFNQQADSALYFAQQGLHYAQKYDNYRELVDAYLLLAILYWKEKKDETQSIQYALKAAAIFKARKDYNGAAAMYNLPVLIHTKRGTYTQALIYSDSALQASQKSPIQEGGTVAVLQSRSALFEALGKKDSALLYFKQYHAASIKTIQQQDVTKIKAITEHYENDKKASEINNKNKQIILIAALLFVIALATLFLIRSNQKIRRQNKIIGRQIDELLLTVEQKQILLSELQHRVKNNLQHVISILEIQKESVNFNTIEELIRSNQNRIHSMALLHKRLNISQSVNEINPTTYLTELSELVHRSYQTQSQLIQINLSCNIKKMAIETALPLGLIIVELLSNSLKHAFEQSQTGKITIVLHENSLIPAARELHYNDNGKGFNFYTTSEKGLGTEIVKGLIGQLDAKVATNSEYNLGGFCLKLNF